MAATACSKAPPGSSSISSRRLATQKLPKLILIDGPSTAIKATSTPTAGTMSIDIGVPPVITASQKSVDSFSISKRQHALQVTAAFWKN